MGFRNRLLFLAAMTALVAGSLFGQVGSGATMGTLTGLVTQEGNPLPGVTVTASSPNLQGTRTTVTNEAGGFNFGALPPGPYTVRFELAGMQTITKSVRVGVAQSARADAEMRVAAVTEAITVTAAAPAVAETTEVQANMPGKLIDELPVARTPAAIALLAPGVVGGVNGPSISGGFSFDNLYTVNGAVIQENLRGQTHNLYIEDAVQETTIQTAGISAEFGNFTGGVVNAITKSGGNEFSGSLRDTLLNPKWTEKSPTIFELDPTTNNTTTRPVTSPENVDELNQTYEATLGGRIIRDRLWFFTAGRFVNLETERVFQGGGGRTYPFTEEERRMEGKLTAAITPRHSVVGSYLDAPVERTNECQVTGCFDMSAIDASTSRPATFATFNYNGIITNNFLIEANWSEKEFTFIGTGGEDPDRVTGTPFAVNKVGGFVNEPYFSGKTPEERDNMAWGAKATYYMGSRALGAHNLIVGYQHWFEKRLSNNYQSPTDFVFHSNFYAPKIVNGVTLVSVRGGTSDFMFHFPILQQSQGSDLNTNSLYVNDKWDLSNRWSFNLGLRYDKNDSKDSRGALIADDSKLSPRLGAAFDVFGTGRLRLNATYGHYVGRLAETIAGAGSAAGNPASISKFYGGPDIIDVTSEEALRQIWAWFDAQGGFDSDNIPLRSISIPGAQRQIPERLVSPNVEEMTFGASTQFGAGFLRVDYVDRDWRDFYAESRSMEIGKVTLPGNRVVDLSLVGNTNNLKRTYQGITVQGGYRLLNRINIGGNYTWSELRGNVSQESVGSVVVTEIAGNWYPEYFNFAQNNPVGFLAGDQTHKIRAWTTIDVPTVVGNFNLSLLQNFDSGDPYSHAATIDIRSSPNFYGPGQAGGVTNPGYVTPPATVGYFFSERGEFRFDDITSTNLALNYNTNPGWMAGFMFFAQAEVLNVFNEDSGTWNTEILTHRTDTTLKRFNPMAGDVPQEGVHWRKGVRYGKPTGLTIPVLSVTGLSSGGSFQIPRTYRFSLGFRF